VYADEKNICGCCTDYKYSSNEANFVKMFHKPLNQKLLKFLGIPEIETAPIPDGLAPVVT